jgi:methylglutaconyl-CoA hydratase
MDGIDVEQRGDARVLWLNRPEQRNALDAATLTALTAAIEAAAQERQVRSVLLAGRGSLFCAGGDLRWLRQPEAIDVAAFPRLLQAMQACPKPVLVRVHGDCFGGGLGLVAAADVAFAVPSAKFCLSEVRLGLIPATIGPYVLRAVGLRAAARYMLTGERFDAQEALRIGLIHQVCPAPDLDACIDAVLGHCRRGGPAAQASIKALLHELAGRSIDEALTDRTVACLAAVRSGAEAQEGIDAFFAHRPPDWSRGPDDVVTRR